MRSLIIQFIIGVMGVIWNRFVGSNFGASEFKNGFRMEVARVSEMLPRVIFTTERNA